MTVHHTTLLFRTSEHDQVLDITDQVQSAVTSSGITSGLCTVYTPHATAAISINENDDPNIGADLLRALGQAVPTRNDWLHDRIDGNAAAHIKSAVVGPSESIPVQDGKLALGRWQNVFFCEFDGPRTSRRVVVTVMG